MTPRQKAPPQVELLTVRPEDVHVEEGFNPRTEVDAEQLEQLADSIKRHGLLQPIIAVPNGGQPKVIGGHRRLAAAKQAGVSEIPVLLRRSETDELVAAILDNGLRVDLTPYEEAMAYGRLQDQGLTVDGIAEHLSVPKRRVTERLRILELPLSARELVGEGKLSTRDVATLADITANSPALAAAMAMAEADEPGSLHDPDAITRVVAKTKGLFDPRTIEPQGHLKLTPELGRQIGALRKVVEAYDTPGVSWETREKVRKLVGYGGKLSLTTQLLDAGRAAGAVVDVACKDRWNARPTTVSVVVDGAWLQENLPPAIEAMHKKISAAIARAKKKDDAGGLTAAEQKERDERKREREKQAREREQAKEFNARLGKALLDGFASIELTIDVVKWLCRGLLMDQPRTSYYGAERYTVGELAADGLRFILPDWQQEVTSRGGKTKLELPTDKQELAKRFWAWWELAETPEEVAGRTVTAYAAAHYANRAAAMSKEQVYTHSSALSGSKEFVRLLEKLVGPKVPARGRA